MKNPKQTVKLLSLVAIGVFGFFIIFVPQWRIIFEDGHTDREGLVLIEVTPEEHDLNHQDIDSSSDLDEVTPQKVPISKRSPVGYKITVEPEDHSISAGYVDLIVGKASGTYQERLSAVYSLVEMTLRDKDALRLLSYLEKSTHDNNLTDEQYYFLINELLLIFHQRPKLNDRYLTVSQKVINNSARNEVIRDYTLQGLSHAIDHATAVQADNIKAVFWENTSRVDLSLAGTSLLALNRLNRDAGLTREENIQLSEIVSKYIRENTVEERTMISSLHVAREMQLKDLSPDIKLALRSSSMTPSETIVAMAVLRTFKDPEFEILDSELKNSQPPLFARKTAQD